MSILKVGDTVNRHMAGNIIMPLPVTEITSEVIVCDLWEFDPVTGVEVDDFFPGVVVSYIDLEPVSVEV